MVTKTKTFNSLAELSSLKNYKNKSKEVMTRKKRNVFTLEQKRHIIEGGTLSKLSIADYCKKMKISRGNYYQWTKLFSQKISTKSDKKVNINKVKTDISLETQQLIIKLKQTVADLFMELQSLK